MVYGMSITQTECKHLWKKWYTVFDRDITTEVYFCTICNEIKQEVKIDAVTSGLSS